jgi:hypothetical protein
MSPSFIEQLDEQVAREALIAERLRESKKADRERRAAAEAAAHELALIQEELRRRAYLQDPTTWAREKLGDTLWSGQRTILRSIRDHRKTAVPTCHEIGKSYVAAIAVAWWLDAHPPGEAFVITSAPTAPQVQAILWREIGRAHARGKLPGRVNQTEWHMTMPVGNEEMVAFGRKPSDYEPTAFQGIHARYVLYIFDEACGMPKGLWEAADSLIANDLGKALAIGNPDDPLSEFAEICKPGSRWNVIHIGAFDSPNFTGEPMPQHVKDQLIGKTYVEEKRAKWAPGWVWSNDGRRVFCPEGTDPKDAHPFWHSKVLGQFPEISSEVNLVPISWVRAAHERWAEAVTVGVHKLGGDVGAGGDRSTCAELRGMRARILWEDRNPDTMHTCGRFVTTLKETGATSVNVDTIGIGKGVVDRGKELSLPFFPINVGEAPTEEHEEEFVNYRAECWWGLRKLFELGTIALDPADDETADELVNLRYKRTSSGKIQIEAKDEYKRRMHGKSPDRAEALMLAAAKPKPGEKKPTRATWGRR